MWSHLHFIIDNSGNESNLFLVFSNYCWQKILKHSTLFFNVIAGGLLKLFKFNLTCVWIIIVRYMSKHGFHMILPFLTLILSLWPGAQVILGNNYLVVMLLIII